MTHTSTEQPWWRKHTDEIELKVASGEMNAATCFTKMLWLVSEAAQAGRVIEQEAYQARAIALDMEAANKLWSDCLKKYKRPGPYELIREFCAITQEKQG
jgi:hypothetical protein